MPTYFQRMHIHDYLAGLYSRLRDPEYAAWYIEDARRFGPELYEMAIDDVAMALRLAYCELEEDESDDSKDESGD